MNQQMLECMAYKRKGVIIREPDIFARAYNHPAGHVEWVLPGRQHPR